MQRPPNCKDCLYANVTHVQRPLICKDYTHMPMQVSHHQKALHNFSTSRTDPRWCYSWYKRSPLQCKHNRQWLHMRIIPQCQKHSYTPNRQWLHMRIIPQCQKNSCMPEPDLQCIWSIPPDLKMPEHAHIPLEQATEFVLEHMCKGWVSLHFNHIQDSINCLCVLCCLFVVSCIISYVSVMHHSGNYPT